MKKSYLLITFIVFSIVFPKVMRGQEIIFSETFENRALGSVIAHDFPEWQMHVYSWRDNEGSIENDDGDKVFRYTIDANSTGSTSSYEVRCNLSGEYQELWVSMDCRLGPDFDPAGGGKWLGGVATSRSWVIPWVVDSTKYGNGSISHAVFHGAGFFIHYTYDHTLPNDSYAKPYGDAHEINVSDFKGEWHNVTTRFVLNTPGIADGYRETFLDGVMVTRQEGNMYISHQQAEQGFAYLWLSFFFGGSTPSNKQEYQELDDITVYYYTPEDPEYETDTIPLGTVKPIVRPGYDIYPEKAVEDTIYSKESDTIKSSKGGWVPPDNVTGNFLIDVPGAESILLEFDRDAWGIVDNRFNPYVKIFEGSGESKILLKQFDADDVPDISDNNLVIVGNTATIEWFTGNDRYNDGWLAKYKTNDGSKNILNLSVQGQGTITPGSGFYVNDTTLELTAISGENWTFKEWIGDISNSVVSDSIITVIMDGDKNITAIFAPEQSSQTSFKEHPKNIPGLIQVEDYDFGGEGIAYHDIDDDNRGNGYRPEEGVDIHSDLAEDSYYVGWFKDGEWLEYTTDIDAGTYDIHIRIGNPNDGRQLKIFLDDSLLTTADIPNTGAYTAWETTTVNNVQIPGGKSRILKLQNVNNDFDINWIEFTFSTDVKANKIHPVTIYPNPVSKIFTIDGKSNTNSPVQVTVYNSFQNQLFQTNNAVILPAQIDLSPFSPGIYFIEIKGEDYYKIEKVIKY